MKVELVRRRRLLDDFFKVDEAVVRFERFDGTMSAESRRLSLERVDGVAALLYNRDLQKVVLTQQFRYSAYEKGPGWMVECIAGMMDAGETPEQSIRREILEEAGYRVGILRQIFLFYVSPGGTSERIYLFFAEVTNADKVELGGGVHTEDEDIRLLVASPAELQASLDSGQLVDGKTIIAAQWFLRFYSSM